MKNRLAKLIKLIKLFIKEKKGEIATILTIVTLGLMLVGTMVGTKLAEQGPRERSEARGFGELKSQALSGCQILDTDLGPGCWCSSGGWQGHCFEGAKRGNKPSDLCTQKCLSGTWGSPATGTLPTPGTAASPVPGEQPTGANCTLSSGPLSPAVGDKCGNCVVFKSGDLEANSLRKAFDNWGFSACNNNQIVSYWCNGGVSVEGKNTCQARLSECKATSADCTGAPGADKYPLPGETKPTAPPGGAPGGPGGPAGPVPTSAPKAGGYLVVKSGPNGYIKTSDPLNPHPDTLNIKPLDNVAAGRTSTVDSTNYGLIPFATITPVYSLSGGIGTWTYNLPIRTNPLINKLDFDAGSPIEVNVIGDNGVAPLPAGQYKVCYPPTTTPGATIAPTIIAGYCDRNNRTETIRLNLVGTTYPTPSPLPTAQYGYYVFDIELQDITNDPSILDHYTIEYGTIQFQRPPNYTVTPLDPSNPIYLTKNSDVTPTYKTNIDSTVMPVIYKTNIQYTSLTNGTILFTTAKKGGTEEIVITRKVNTPSIPVCLSDNDLTDSNDVINLCKEQYGSNFEPVVEKLLINGWISPSPTPTPDTSLTPGEETPAAPTPLTGTADVTFEITSKLIINGAGVWRELPSSNSVMTYLYQIRPSALTLSAPDWKIDSSTGLEADNITYTKSYGQIITGYDLPLLNRASLTDPIFKVMSQIEGSDAAWCATGWIRIPVIKEITKQDLISSLEKHPDKISLEITTTINCQDLSKSNSDLTIKGSSNEAFRLAMEKWVKGEMGVLQMSAFINQLTRTPGLQIGYCDPRKGECNLTY